MNQSEQWIFGAGAAAADLSFAEMRRIIEQSFQNFDFGKRVLAIVPDNTRDDLTDVLFPVAAEVLNQKGVAKFDALVAQGTHAPMSAAEKNRKIGSDKQQLSSVFGQIFDHDWNNPRELASIGEISRREVLALSGGLFAEDIAPTVNKRLSPECYNTILIFSSTVPHEVAGFSGGAKYFFPGVAGAELTNATHRLGALAKIENVIGKIEPPTRRLIDRATEFIKTPVVYINSVVSRTAANRLRAHALFVGDVKTAFLRAAQISGAVHVK